MIIYTLMFALSVVFAYIAQANKSAVVVEDGGVKYRLNRIFLILSALVPIFFAGMRGGIADSSAYINSFNSVVWSDVRDLITGKVDGKAPGYYLLEWLIKQVVDNYTVWFFLIAIFSVVCLWIGRQTKRYEEIDRLYRAFSPTLYYPFVSNRYSADFSALPGQSVREMEDSSDFSICHCVGIRRAVYVFFV